MDKLKQHFDKLTDKEKVDALWEHIQRLEEVVFNNQQELQQIESETNITVTEEERLQRKEVWSKEEVCDYFGISTKTFERWKKEGEIKVMQIKSKDYCRLIDLKDMFRDRGEDLY